MKHLGIASLQSWQLDLRRRSHSNLVGQAGPDLLCTITQSLDAISLLTFYRQYSMVALPTEHHTPDNFSMADTTGANRHRINQQCAGIPVRVHVHRPGRCRTG